MFRTVVASVLLFSSPSFAQEPQGGRVLDGKFHHLGDDIIDSWPEVSKEPEGVRLDVRFQAEKNDGEVTLSVTYWDVNHPSAVQVNGKTIDKLPPSQSRKVVYVRVPPGTLKSGENWLNILPSPQDDCVIGNVVLFPKSFADLMQLGPVTISVRDDKGQSVPARILISNADDKPAPIFLAPTNGTAVRNGIIYVTGKETTVHLSHGNYTIYAGRGMEWSRAKKVVTVSKTGSAEASLSIRREVDTEGFVAADTHLHTLTFSGHGDASIHERMVTLAGEGVEFAVATDHNHHTDYRPYQERLKLNKYFTPTTGNEVTTRLGHFNAFPMKPGKNVPDHKETNWVKLAQDIRIHGAKVIIVNHPRAGRFNVFEPTGYNTFTGDFNPGIQFPFDGLEIINAGGLRANALPLFYDWFGLLNSGVRIFAVGGSDSHGVAAQVGLGRTYIRSSTDEPSRISVDEMCKNFLAGRSSIAMGIFSEVTVDGNYTMGQTAPVKSDKVDVKLRIACPSWIVPTNVLVVVNGATAAERKLEPSFGAINRVLTFSIPAPLYDSHVICVVEGRGVRGPAWVTDQDYAVSATNPVFLDADHDGKYQSPRDSARAVLARTGSDLDNQWKEIVKADNGTALQMISLVLASTDPKTRESLMDKLQNAPDTRPIFRRYRQSLKPAPAAGG